MIQTQGESGGEFLNLLAAIREGSEEAVWKLIETYDPHIRRIIRRKLNEAIKVQFESIDFAQMVWASFLVEPERIRSFGSERDLLRYLSAMAANKVLDQYRRMNAFGKRDAQLGSFHDDQQNLRTEHQASPSQIVIAREKYHELIDSLEDKERCVLQLRLKGYKFREIADELEMDESTARRIIKRVAVRVGGLS